MTRGRKRLTRCTAGHLLTDSNRRRKFYIRADGTSQLLSNGCRPCNVEKTREYKRVNAVAIKARRCGL